MARNRIVLPQPAVSNTLTNSPLAATSETQSSTRFAPYRALISRTSIRPRPPMAFLGDACRKKPELASRKPLGALFRRRKRRRRALPTKEE
jgi:hypothetical protein